MNPPPLYRRYDALLLDLDGVLFRGDVAVLGAPETLGQLRRDGARLVYLTNNSSRTPQEVAAKLTALGFPAGPDEVLTSALATADLLAREEPRPRTAFVIGERGIREALEAIGIEVVGLDAERADVVVVGWDRTATYQALRAAGLLVQRGARLVATNPDLSYPAPDGLWPGAGALLAAVVATTGAHPTIVGKPAAPMFEAAAARAVASRPLFVGDRLDTDIAGAESMGWDSLLVLSGAHTLADLARSDALPVYVARTVAGVLAAAFPARPRPPGPGDLDRAERLVRDAGLPWPAEPGGALRHLVLHDDDGGIAATASLFDVGGDGVVRAVAVDARCRGQGLGALAVAAAAREARRAGLRDLYALTETAEGLFVRLGFETVDRTTLPSALARSEHATGACATATPLVLRARTAG